MNFLAQTRSQLKSIKSSRLMLRANYAIKDRAHASFLALSRLLTPDIHPLFRLVNTPLGREKREWTPRARKWRVKRVCHLRIYFYREGVNAPSPCTRAWLAILWQFISRLKRMFRLFIIIIIIHGSRWEISCL